MRFEVKVLFSVENQTEIKSIVSLAFIIMLKALLSVVHPYPTPKLRPDLLPQSLMFSFAILKAEGRYCMALS